MAEFTKTNISAEHQEMFNALTSGKYSNFALFSCFVDGQPSSAIVAITRGEDAQILIQPLFVAVTDAMKLTDHDGEEPTT